MVYVSFLGFLNDPSSLFLELIQKLPEPWWVIQDYINEKERGQWQEKYEKVYQQDTETQKDAFCHVHSILLNHNISMIRGKCFAVNCIAFSPNLLRERGQGFKDSGIQVLAFP